MISSIYEQHSNYNFTNRSSISPDIEQFDIKAVFAPPYYSGACDLDFRILDKLLAVDTYVWNPSESIFAGKEIPMNPSLIMQLDLIIEKDET